MSINIVKRDYLVEQNEGRYNPRSPLKEPEYLWGRSQFPLLELKSISNNERLILLILPEDSGHDQPALLLWPCIYVVHCERNS